MFVLTPELIMAIATGIEMITRDLLRDLEAMNEEERAEWVKKQKVRKAQHDRWLQEHQPQ
jgi:hypothetical protein